MLITYLTSRGQKSNVIYCEIFLGLFMGIPGTVFHNRTREHLTRTKHIRFSLNHGVISSVQAWVGPQMPLTHKRVGVHVTTQLRLCAKGRRGWGRRQAQLHTPPHLRVRGRWGVGHGWA
jgi:hypothetical protein